MTNQTNHTQNAIEAARAAAAAAAAAASSVAEAIAEPAAVIHESQVVATYTPSAMPPAARATMDDLSDGVIAADGWLKVKDTGLLAGETKRPVETIKVKINLVEGLGYTPCTSVKFGNPVQYIKTYHKTTDPSATTVQGKSWRAEVQRAFAVDPECKGEYPSVDLVMTLLEDSGSMKKGEVIAHGTATTSFKHFVSFLKEAKAAGLDGKEVEAVLGCKSRQKGSNSWGELTFTLVGEHFDEE